MTLKSAFDRALAEKVMLSEEDKPVTRRQAIVYSIIDKAMRGDLQAAAFIRDIGGEKTAAGPKDQTLTIRLAE